MIESGVDEPPWVAAVLELDRDHSAPNEGQGALPRDHHEAHVPRGDRQRLCHRCTIRRARVSDFGTLTIGYGGAAVWAGDEQLADTTTVIDRGDGAGGIGMWLGGAHETIGALRVEGGLLLGAGDASTTGRLSTASLTATSTADMEFVIDGAGSDRIDVRGGAVDLGGARLTLLAASPPTPGTTLTLVAIAGTTQATSTFAGLPEGAAVDVDGVPAVVSYRGGDGNDITVHVPLPSETAPTPPTPAQASGFSAVVPRRVLETRPSEPGGQVGYSGSKPAAGQMIQLTIPDVPAGTGAVALNVTAVDPAGPAFVTVWPCGAPRPQASNLNPTPTIGATANLVISKLGDNNQVCLFSNQSTHLIADLQGTFPNT